MLRRLTWLVALALTGCHWVFPYTTSSAPDQSPVGDGPVQDRGVATRPPWTRFLIAQESDAGWTRVASRALARDADGNIYLSAACHGTVDVDPGLVVDAPGNPSLLLVSYSSDGALRWHRVYASTRNLEARALAVRDQLVYAAGLFSGSAEIGGTSYDLGTLQQVLLLLHSTAGEAEAVYLFQPQGVNAQGQALGVSSGGLVAIGGVYGSTLDLGCGALPAVPGQVEHGFMAAWSSAMQCTWSRAIPALTGVATQVTEPINRANAAWMEDSGASFFAGEIVGPTDLGGGALAAKGGKDAFFAAYDPNGALSFGASFGSVADDIGTAAAATPDGEWIVVGEVGGDVDYGGLTVTGRGGSDALVLRVGKNGTVRWARHLGGPGADSASAVAVGADGTIHVAGCFTGQGDFGDHSLVAATLSTDAFVVAMDGEGKVQRAGALGGAGEECATGLAVEPSGAVVLSGRFKGQTTIGEAKASSTAEAGFVHLLLP